MHFFLILFCIIFPLVIYFLSVEITAIQFGKDGGLLARVIMTAIFSEILFYFILNSFLKYFLGFFIVIFSYVLVIIIYYIVYNYVLNGKTAMKIPLVFDEYFTFLIIYLIAIRKLKK